MDGPHLILMGACREVFWTSRSPLPGESNSYARPVVFIDRFI